MYSESIKEHENKIKRCERFIEKATNDNKKKLIAMLALFIVPGTIGILIGGPWFNHPYAVPALGFALGSFGGVEILNGYLKNDSNISGWMSQIKQLESEIAKMRAYDNSEQNARGRIQGATQKNSYNPQNNKRDETYSDVPLGEDEDSKGRGTRK